MIAVLVLAIIPLASAVTLTDTYIEATGTGSTGFINGTLILDSIVLESNWTEFHGIQTDIRLDNTNDTTSYQLNLYSLSSAYINYTNGTEVARNVDGNYNITLGPGDAIYVFNGWELLIGCNTYTRTGYRIVILIASVTMILIISVFAWKGYEQGKLSIGQLIALFMTVIVGVTLWLASSQNLGNHCGAIG